MLIDQSRNHNGGDIGHEFHINITAIADWKEAISTVAQLESVIVPKGWLVFGSRKKRRIWPERFDLSEMSCG
jgi:hypothetical protein